MKVLVACVFLVAAAQAADWANLKPVSRTKPVQGHIAPASRIIGGSLATTGQFKYQVAVITDDNVFCGGSLIKNNVVLTAAHCINGGRSWEIHAGALYFPNDQESGRVIIKSTDATVHENFGVDHDIAVIRLPNNISGPNIGTVRLPSRSQAGDDLVGITARVSGWGRISDSDPYLSPDLKFVDVDIISNNECAYYFGPIVVNDSKLCVGTDGGTAATCTGDSGGPLVITDFDGLPTQVGILAFITDRGCEYDAPAGFTRITEYLDWLETNAGVTIKP